MNNVESGDVMLITETFIVFYVTVKVLLSLWLDVCMKGSQVIKVWGGIDFLFDFCMV